jgi:hypothetical protein
MAKRLALGGGLRPPLLPFCLCSTFRLSGRGLKDSRKVEDSKNHRWGKRSLAMDRPHQHRSHSNSLVTPEFRLLARAPSVSHKLAQSNWSVLRDGDKPS